MLLGAQQRCTSGKENARLRNCHARVGERRTLGKRMETRISSKGLKDPPHHRRLVSSRGYCREQGRRVRRKQLTESVLVGHSGHRSYLGKRRPA